MIINFSFIARKLITNKSFLLLKKTLSGGTGIKCFQLKKEICDHRKFDILCEELGNGELSIDCFINTTNSFAKDLSITSSTEKQKSDVLK